MAIYRRYFNHVVHQCYCWWNLDDTRSILTIRSVKWATVGIVTNMITFASKAPRNLRDISFQLVLGGSGHIWSCTDSPVASCRIPSFRLNINQLDRKSAYPHASINLSGLHAELSKRVDYMLDLGN